MADDRCGLRRGCGSARPWSSSRSAGPGSSTRSPAARGPARSSSATGSSRRSRGSRAPRPTPRGRRCRARRDRRGPRAPRPPRPPPRARQRGRGDGGVAGWPRPPTAASRPSARCRTRRRRPTSRASSPGCARPRPPPARRWSCSSTGPSRSGGEASAWPRSASSPTPGAVGFSDDGSPVKSAGHPPQRAALPRDAGPAALRARRGPGAHGGRRGERGVRGVRPGPQGLAGRRRGRRRASGRSRCWPRSCPTPPRRGSTSPTSRPPGRSTRCAGRRRPGCRSPATSRRTTSASPTSGSPGRGAGPGRRSTTTAIARDPWADGALVAHPYATACKVNPPLRAAEDAAAVLAALVDGTADAVATDHAPHTQVDKEAEFGLAANGISGLETALGVLLAAVGRRPADARPGDRGADDRPGASARRAARAARARRAASSRASRPTSSSSTPGRPGR